MTELEKLHKENKELRGIIFKLKAQLAEIETTVRFLDISDETIEESVPSFEPETDTETQEFDVSEHTQIKCPKCGAKSYDRSGECLRCNGRIVI